MAGPEQLGLGGAGGVEVVHLDLVLLAGDEADRAAVLLHRVPGPVVNDGLAVDGQAYAVVGAGGEGVGLRVEGLHPARPAHGEVVGGHGGGGGVGAPVEVDGRVGTGGLEL